MNPLVSVGLPVRNGERFLRLALDSLLAQDYDNYEIVLSDNASTDSTRQICEDYCRRDARLRYYLNETDIGAIGNFQRVLELARGKYFVWMAHDDLCEPSYLRTLVEFLEQNPDYLLCGSDIRLVDENGNFLSTVSLARIYPYQVWKGARKLFFEYPTRDVLYTIYGMFRTEHLKQVGVGGTNWKGFVESSETPLLAKVAVAGAIAAIPPALKVYRLHSSSNYRKELARKGLFDHFCISLDVVRKLFAIVARSRLPLDDKLVLLSVVATSWLRSLVRASLRRVASRARR